jgi:hypothetical protein
MPPHIPTKTAQSLPAEHGATMPSSTDPRVDAYIRKSAPFAQPILEHIRAIVHAAVPGASETIKWSMPFFEKDGILCNMAAFKAHVALRFWRGAQVVDGATEGGMGDFGRITTLKDLPTKAALIAMLRKTAALNAEGAQTPVGARIEKQRAAAKKKAATEPEIPADFASALRRTAGATAHFRAMPPSHRREYVQWITGAKRDATRTSRIAKAVALIADGKSQNWKYAAKP